MLPGPVDTRSEVNFLGTMYSWGECSRFAIANVSLIALR